jgi:hypothetical protein
VQKGIAECLYAANYLPDASQMNFYQKLCGFERLNSLNERASTKTLHVSLNFDPSERISDKKLVEIANAYMGKIGFGEQPFLIYKHADAGHPHIHIVSNTIKADGSRINTHNIGRNQSEKARKEIEEMFGLVRAERQQQIIKPGIKTIDIGKVMYGKQETKSSISNVVGAVFNQYKFSSLPEFNAALKQFNVIADRGKEESRIYKNRGLLFRILDADGNKLGVPIKASIIDCKPTLNNLEKKFIANEAAREPLKQRTKNAIDECLRMSPNGMRNFVATLQQKQIYTVLKQNVEGRPYGITFVDNQSQCVFNGSDLGQGYSVAALQNRIVSSGMEHSKNETSQGVGATDKLNYHLKNDLSTHAQQEQPAKNDSLLEVLITPKQEFGNTSFQLLKKKQKMKKKQKINVS